MTEETLFHEALAQGDAAERAAFLDAACAGQPERRAAVEARLAAHAAAPAEPDATGTHTPQHEHGATQSYAPGEAEPGVIVASRYTLVQKLGEGGMGEVWVARQTEPVKRKVALKLIKAGMDSRSVVQRFEQERQALALMDHPNIARVLDGGLTADRRPYFVMELVNGMPLTKFCDEAKLDIRARLELFVPICQAVQHAHQKGIVHRDLKPSNILVTLIDGRPVPKVIDFGVAKATSGKLTDESMSTQFGAVIGTLEYMSPEQAGFSGADVDTRADIYSLGVILYELLTGLRPFDAKRLRQAALDEMIRIIREEEPAKPSTRLSTDASSPSLAAVRQMEPGRLSKLLRGELDWVVMKCLEKQRDRRYETVNGLAQDIQRYLVDEPVTARPPSARYKLRKFVRRNRGTVAAGLTIAFLLIAGAAVSAWQAVRATRAEVQATQERDDKEAARADAEKQAAEALKQKKEADAQRERAEENARRVRGAVDAYFTQIDENRLMRSPLPGLQSLRKELLEAALPYYQQLVRQHGSDPFFRFDLALAYNRVGHILRQTGDAERALEAYEKSRDLTEQLHRDSPLVGYLEQQQWTCNEIGLLLADRGRNEDARAAFKKGIGAGREALRRYPGRPGVMENLAWNYNNLAVPNRRLGSTREAFVAYLQSLELWHKLRLRAPASASSAAGLATVYSNVAFLQFEAGWSAEAATTYRRAEDMFRQGLRDFDRTAGAENYTRLQLRSGFVYQRTGQGLVLATLDRPAEALAAHQEAQGLVKELARDNPAVAQVQVRLALVHANLGHLLLQTKKFDDAGTAFRQAIDAAGRVPRDTLDQPDTDAILAWSRAGLGYVLLQQGKHPEAITVLREAVKLGQTATAHYAWNHCRLAGALAQLSAAIGQAKKEPTAEERAEQDRLAASAVASVQAALARDVANLVWLQRDPLLDPLRQHPEFQQLLGRIEKDAAARRPFVLPTSTPEARLERAQALPDGSAERAEQLVAVGTELLLTGKATKAEPLLREALEIYHVLKPDSTELAEALHRLYDVCAAGKRPADGIVYLREATELYLRFPGMQDYAIHHPLHNLLGALRKLGRLAEAEPVCRQALAASRRDFGPDDELQTLESEATLAGILLELHKSDAEAEGLYRHILEVRRRVRGPDNKSTVLAVKNLGVAFMWHSKLPEAETLYRQALDDYRGVTASGNRNTIDILAALWDVLDRQRKYAEAAAIGGEYRDVVQRFHGADSEQCTDALYKLGVDHLQLKKAAEAESFFDQLLASFRRKYGPEDARTQLKLQQLARLLSNSSSWQRGAALYREALAVQRKQAAPDPVAFTFNLLGLGQNLSTHDNPKEGEPLLRECLELSRKSLPQSHVYMVPLTESVLGDCLRRQQRFAEAEPLLLGALPGLEKAQTLPASYKIAALERLVNLYDAWEKQDKAAEWRQKWEEAKAAQKQASKS